MSGVSSAVWRSMRSSRDGARSTRWRSPACANGWPASARRIPAAFPAGTPLRLLGGFAGNGLRFRHGPWASGWLSAGVVRRRARRPGEIPAYGGVSGWFGLRNRPEVCSSQAEFAGSSGTGGRCKACWLHRRLSDWRSRSVAAKLWRADDEVDARQPYGRFLAMVSGGALLTSIWMSILVTKVRRNGGLTETLKGRRCRPRVSATFPLTPVR